MLAPCTDDEVVVFLNLLADTLLDTPGGGGGCLVRLTASAEDVEVATLDLDGRHPTAVLLGSAAPEDCIALGVATTGRTRPLDEAPDVAGHGRAEVVVIVHRGGRVIGRIRPASRPVITEPPAYGLTLDCLQRALGLPTPDPLVPTGHLFAASWLDNVVVAGGGTFPLTWADACALHPARQMLAAGGEPDEGIDVIDAARALERVCDWERLRWLTVEGSWQGANLDPVNAAWFDAGAFSRWVLAEWPSVPRLLDAVRQTAGPSIARRCGHALRQLGVLPGGRRRRSAA